MKTIKAQNKQNLFDIAIQAYGNLDHVLELALANNKSVTSELEAGEELEIHEVTDVDTNVIALFETRTIKPATASSQAELELLNQNCGIGCMIVGLTFIVAEDTAETLEEIRLLNQAS